MAANEEFWSPNLVDSIHAFIRRGIPKENSVLTHDRAFVRNISYNLQYLEYLNYVLSETNLHSTVKAMSQKSFVMTGMSVIEAILWFLLKNSGNQHKKEWDALREFKGNEFTENGCDYKLSSTLLKKVENPTDREMSLESMIKKTEDKKLLGVDAQVYRDLNYLRKLRNRIHIHAVQHDKDTDWWSFNTKEVDVMKGVLGSVLRSDLFRPTNDHDRLLSHLTSSAPIESLVDEVATQ